MVDLLASRIASGDFAVLLDISAMLLSEGHPTRLREAMVVFEAAGFAAEAQEARAKLPQVASAYLTARLAEGDMTRLHEAIFEAEAEGLSEQAAEARAQLPQLVNPLLSWNNFYSSCSHLHNYFDKKFYLSSALLML